MKRLDLSTLTIDKARESVNSGSKEEITKYINQVWDECTSVERLLAEIISSILSFYSKKLGEESVIDAWRYSLTECWKPIVDVLKKMDYEQVIDFFPAVHRAIGTKLDIEQDEEKTVITCVHCGTAGNMMKDGKFDNTNRHPSNLVTTKKLYEWSDKKVGIPFYCVRSYFMFDILPKEWGWDQTEFHYGRQFDDDGNPVDEKCTLTVYKTPKKR
jgi:hypothetical protein